MLALTRKKDEAIIIDGGISIKVLDIQGDKVRLGIAAPRDTNIYREEIYSAVERSNREAMLGDKMLLSDIKGLINTKEQP